MSKRMWYLVFVGVISLLIGSSIIYAQELIGESQIVDRQQLMVTLKQHKQKLIDLGFLQYDLSCKKSQRAEKIIQKIEALERRKDVSVERLHQYNQQLASAITAWQDNLSKLRTRIKVLPDCQALKKQQLAQQQQANTAAATNPQANQEVFMDEMQRDRAKAAIRDKLKSVRDQLVKTKHDYHDLTCTDYRPERVAKFINDIKIIAANYTDYSVKQLKQDYAKAHEISLRLADMVENKRDQIEAVNQLRTQAGCKPIVKQAKVKQQSTDQLIDQF